MNDWVAARDQQEALSKAQIITGCDRVELQQDEDVLDTWFSSAILPFANFGWPDKVIGIYLCTNPSFLPFLRF